jgi:exodeoxyribonuclease VII small subunit
MTKAKRSFEEMTAELEEILQVLERGEQPLEEMLRLYSRGVELAGQCRARLEAAEAVLSNAAEVGEK